MRQFAVVLLLVFSLVSIALAKDGNDSKFQVDSVLGEKVVLCEIDFQPDSYTLSDKAKEILDLVVTQLKAVDTEAKVIRIEGYFSSQDTATELTRLSMLRALAVEDYIRLKHAVNFERFLTGHNDLSAECRAEISIYDNPWNVDAPPVEVTDRNNIDGPS